MGLGGKEDAMANDVKRVRPCDRKANAPWKPDHLYVGDNGEVLCGSCMGVESTYRPWCWSDLGEMRPDRSITYPPMLVGVGPGRLVPQGTTTYRCENDLEGFRRGDH
jgi:hypothetical protein